jgi:putative endonuclease
MIFSVYILYAEIHKKTYVGYTSNLINRMASHNSLATKGYTIAYRPWKVIHLEYFQSKTEALIREKALKSGKGREYIKKEIIPFMKEVGFISA